MTFFLEAAQVVDAAGDGRFGQDARGLLERRRGDERTGRSEPFVMPSDGSRRSGILIAGSHRSAGSRAPQSFKLPAKAR
jgi:hypothetical protein